MKKILLTLVVGFCFGGMAIAQEPTKRAKKKALKTSLSTTSPEDAARLKAKTEKAKAYESGKAAPSTPAKAALTVDKAN